jgi:16S rRNA (guanine527-N7)-methyltransferase
MNKGNGSRARIARRAERAGVQLRPEVVQALASYLDILAVWNRKMNLTALGDEDTAIDRLLLEPVMAVRFVPNDATGFLDVGSGAGSPAIPLKISMPWMRVWLVESKVRKSAFLLEVVRQLGLDQVDVETCRFEDLAWREDINRVVDLVTVRAVRVDGGLWTALERFVQPGASVFLFGGPTPRDRRTVPPAFEVRGDDHLLEANGSRLLRLRRL